MPRFYRKKRVTPPFAWIGNPLSQGTSPFFPGFQARTFRVLSKNESQKVDKNQGHFLYVSPYIAGQKVPPDPYIYTPPREVASGARFATFGSFPPDPPGWASLALPSGNLDRKVPHFGAEQSGSGLKVLPNWSGFPIS